MSIDLHSHTTYSDGVLTPGELVRAAAAAGVRVLAVTDHDTTEGVTEALQAATSVGLRILPGIEISSRHGERNLHMLAFFPRSALGRLADWQAERRAARWERLLGMLDRLDELGAPVDRQAVLAEREAHPGSNPGRPHVARALVAAGHVADMQQAFEIYLARGKPAYVEDRVPDAATAIAMAHRLGGVTSLAHPNIDDLDQILEELVELGLDGVEAFHGSHEPEVAQHYLARARALGLLVSGGSDFHGPRLDTQGGDEPGGALGQAGLPEHEWARLEQALARRENQGET
jgi:3',5'-nucleoside bisphosphate phosphatase